MRAAVWKVRTPMSESQFRGMTRAALEERCHELTREVARLRTVAREFHIEVAKALRANPLVGAPPGDRLITDPFAEALATGALEPR